MRRPSVSYAKVVAPFCSRRPSGPDAGRSDVPALESTTCVNSSAGPYVYVQSPGVDDADASRRPSSRVQVQPRPETKRGPGTAVRALLKSESDSQSYVNVPNDVAPAESASDESLTGLADG